MRRRQRDADHAHHAAASAWLREVSAAIDERVVVDIRDIAATADAGGPAVSVMSKPRVATRRKDGRAANGRRA